MTTYTSFEDLARDIFLYNAHIPTYSNEIDKLHPTPLADDVSFVVNAFADAHCELFRLIFGKNIEVELKTDRQLFEFAIPRCLKLIDNYRYFYSMMLVVSFLQELTTFLEKTRNCYRFHYRAYKCFAAVFERYFKNSFESNGGWSGLQEYLIYTIDTIDTTEEKTLLSALNEADAFLCDRVASLIENCDNVTEEYCVNDYETDLLMEDDDKVKESLSSEEEDLLSITWPINDEMINETLNYIKEMSMKESDSRYCDVIKDLDLLSSKLTESCIVSYTGNEVEGPSVSKGNAKECMLGSDGDKGFSQSKSNARKDLYVSESMDLEIVSILEVYMQRKVTEAEKCLETNQFWEKMERRTCPCCGSKCYQVSCKLFSKQVDLHYAYKTT